MNIQQALARASDILHSSSPSARLDAQVLLGHVLNSNSAHLHAWPEKELEPQQQSDFFHLVEQRHQGLPVAQLTGQREFWSLPFKVDGSTLIPRPETETLVEFILQHFNHASPISLLDMGTGSGAIAIAIASERPGWNIVASDNSEAALQLAHVNSEENKTDNVTFILSDWFENLGAQRFDIIVSNPPYIASDDPHLQQGDVRFEPHSALTAGSRGMDDIEQLCTNAYRQLANTSENSGWLIIEHGYNQAEMVRKCFTENHFSEIIQRQDLSGQTRMTAGRMTDNSTTANDRDATV